MSAALLSLSEVLFAKYSLLAAVEIIFSELNLFKTAVFAILLILFLDVCPLTICPNSLAITAATSLSFPAYVRSLFSGADFGEIGSILLKALGVAFLAQICSDICRDCGENSAAAGVELVAKLEILLLCLPMLEKVLGTAREVLSW